MTKNTKDEELYKSCLSEAINSINLLSKNELIKFYAELLYIKSKRRSNGSRYRKSEKGKSTINNCVKKYKKKSREELKYMSNILIEKFNELEFDITRFWDTKLDNRKVFINNLYENIKNKIVYTDEILNEDKILELYEKNYNHIIAVCDNDLSKLRLLTRYIFNSATTF